MRVAVDTAGRVLGFATVSDRPDGACELDDLTVVAGDRTVPFYERVGFVAGEAVQTQFAPALRLWRALTRSG